jgi:phospholipid/cholesterol/gamma-HCH transport system permease protein
MAFIESRRDGTGLSLALAGDWRAAQLAAIRAEFSQLDVAGADRVTVDPAGADIDLAGAWELDVQLQRLEAAGVAAQFAGDEPATLRVVRDVLRERRSKPRPADVADDEPNAVHRLGKTVVERFQYLKAGVAFVGRVTATLARALTSLRRLRLTSVTRHVYDTGITAIPIVSLIAFLISVIIAYMAASQLRDYGADIFVVDLITVGVAARAGRAADGDHRRRPLRQRLRRRDRLDAAQRGSRRARGNRCRPGGDAGPAAHHRPGDRPAAADRRRRRASAWPAARSSAPAARHAAAAVHPAHGRGDRPVHVLGRHHEGAGVRAADRAAGTYRGMQVRGSSRELGRLTTVAVVQSIFLVLLADALFACCSWSSTSDGDQAPVATPAEGGPDAHPIEVRGVVNRFGAQVVHDGLDMQVRRARCSASSAARAPASRCCCGRSSACSGRRPARCASSGAT